MQFRSHESKAGLVTTFDHPRRRCVVCDQPFEAYTDRHRFCSDRCRYGYRDRARESRSGVKAGTEITATCCDCGRSFSYVLVTKRRKRCEGCVAAKSDDFLAARLGMRWSR